MKTLITSAIIAVSATSAFANNCGFDANDGAAFKASRIANLVIEGAAPSHVAGCAVLLSNMNVDAAVAPVAAELEALEASIPAIKQAQAQSTYEAVQGQIEIAKAQAYDSGVSDGYEMGVTYTTDTEVAKYKAQASNFYNISQENAAIAGQRYLEIQELNSTINGLELYVSNIQASQEYWHAEAQASAPTIEALKAEVAAYKADLAEASVTIIERNEQINTVIGERNSARSAFEKANKLAVVKEFKIQEQEAAIQKLTQVKNASKHFINWINEFGAQAWVINQSVANIKNALN